MFDWKMFSVVSTQEWKTNRFLMNGWSLWTSKRAALKPGDRSFKSLRFRLPATGVSWKRSSQNSDSMRMSPTQIRSVKTTIRVHAGIEKLAPHAWWLKRLLNSSCVTRPSIKEEALLQALDEVRLRINSNVRIF